MKVVSGLSHGLHWPLPRPRPPDAVQCRAGGRANRVTVPIIPGDAAQGPADRGRSAVQSITADGLGFLREGPVSEPRLFRCFFWDPPEGGAASSNLDTPPLPPPPPDPRPCAKPPAPDPPKSPRPEVVRSSAGAGVVCPPFGVHSRSIPQGMIFDVQPLVKSLFCPIRRSPMDFFILRPLSPETGYHFFFGGGGVEGGVKSLCSEGFGRGSDWAEQS